MFFPISNSHINPLYLVVVGFVIGILGGFFGVGGSFIAGPALRLMGVDWNYAVGTDLAHIVGKSIVAARKHRTLGNVDMKLGMIMALGTIGGAEGGAQLIQALKRAGNVNTVVSWVAIVVYVGISVFMLWESHTTLRLHKGRSRRTVQAAESKVDHSAFGPVTKKIQGMKIWPMINASIAICAARRPPPILNGTMTAATPTCTNSRRRPKKKVSAKKRWKAARSKQSGTTGTARKW